MTKTALISKNGIAIANSILFTLIGLIYYITIPDGYAYNGDLISSYGMAIAEGFLEVQNEIFERRQWGYVNNGQFSAYTNWPPLGFLLQALWMKAWGVSLLQARLFMVLVSLCSVFFFYQITKALDLSPSNRMLTTLLFSLLPFHLTHSSLIFADTWVLFFWTLFIWAYLKSQTWSTLLVLTCLGILFMWIIPLIGIAFIIYRWLSRKNYSYKILLRGLAIICMVIWISIFALKSCFPQSTLISQLYFYSIFSFSEHPLSYSMQTMKTMGLLILEALPLLYITVSNRRKLSTQAISPHLKQVIHILLLTAFTYVVLLPGWATGHTHPIIFFDLLIVLLYIAVLKQIPQQNQVRNSLIAISLCILTSLMLPCFTSKKIKEITQRDSKIIELINKDDHNNDKKICIFYDTPNKASSIKFVVRNLCNAYLFEEIPSFNLFPEFLRKSKERIRLIQLNQKVNYDFAYLITEKQELNLPEELIVNSTEIEHLKVYKLNWQ